MSLMFQTVMLSFNSLDLSPTIAEITYWITLFTRFLLKFGTPSYAQMVDIEGFAFLPPLHFKTDLLSSVVCCVQTFWRFLWSFCVYGYFRHNLGLLVFLRLVNLTAEQQRTCEVNQGILILREPTNKSPKNTDIYLNKKPSKCKVTRWKHNWPVGLCWMRK